MIPPSRHFACACGIFVAALVPAAALAAEGFRLRESPLGLFGGELASFQQKPGFFGAGTLTYTEIQGIADASGNPLTIKAVDVALPTAVPTGGAVPNGSFRLRVPAGSISLKQEQTQVNLVGGYATDSVYAGGALVFRANLPVIYQSRSFLAQQAAGTIVPTPSAPLPAPAIAAINAIGNAANSQVQSSLAATNASQTQNVSGIGDLQVSAAWVRAERGLRTSAALSVYLPTGEYDAARGPNPGYGKFRTVVAGVAASYALGQPGSGEGAADGLIIAARANYGTNGTNSATNYRTGDFTSVETALLKVAGPWAFGANVLAIRQLKDDTLNGAVVPSSRYRSFAAGPFVSYEMPGRDVAINAHYSQTFGERNANVSRSLQVRIVRAWR